MQQPSRVWTVAEAKSRLSEVLRLSEEQPQHIGTRKTYVVVPATVWRERTRPAEHLGRWLTANMPRGVELDDVLPRRDEPGRTIPFVDHDA